MIESMNLWQRTNDKQWTICITVREGSDIGKSSFETDAYIETLTKRIRFTGPIEKVLAFQREMIDKEGIK